MLRLYRHVRQFSTIGIPKEYVSYENRVAVTPTSVKRLIKTWI